MASNELTPGARDGQHDGERAAGVILYRRAAGGAPRFLLLETRNGGHYSPPKGHLDPGESDEEAARRETLEEAGLRPVALDPEFRAEIGYDVLTRKGKRRRKSVVYFLGEAEPGEPRLSEEHTSWRWAAPGEIEALVPFASLRDVLARAARRIAAAAGGDPP